MLASFDSVGFALQVQRDRVSADGRLPWCAGYLRLLIVRGPAQILYGVRSLARGLGSEEVLARARVPKFACRASGIGSGPMR